MIRVSSDFDFFRCGGSGGQHRDKASTGARVTHIATGISVSCTEERSQLQNRKKAFIRLCNHPEFRKWLKLEIARRQGLLANVNEMMAEKNLKVEYFAPSSKK